MKNLIDSLYIFASMIIGGFTFPFVDDNETVHSDNTEA